MIAKKPAHTIHVGVRLDADTHARCLAIAPDGNVSAWVRTLIRREIEKLEGRQGSRLKEEK
jgi:hypothetical protein